MISPLRCPYKFKSINSLKEIITKGSIVGTYLFFDGNIELGLCSPERFVIAHTNNYPISEFWACARFDPARLTQIIEHLSRIQEKKIMYAMQESWASYKDPFIRSAVFFLLNRYSSQGLVSSGEIDFERYNPVCLRRLKPLKNLQNFHLTRTKSENFVDDIESSATQQNVDYVVVPVGKYNYNLFEDGKSMSHEGTKIDHTEIEKYFKQQKHNTILIYKKHPELFKVYENSNITMIDARGNTTENTSLCEEMIIANF